MNSDFRFVKAVPVWKKDSTEEINQTLDFAANVKNEPGSKLFVAGSTSFIIYVNGRFAGFGPARTAHGFYKVDEIELDGLLTKEENIITIRVSGYNANSFCYLQQPSFLCAEILCGEKVVAFTGKDFKAFDFEGRVVKVPRYSYQRTFCEAYKLSDETFNLYIEEKTPVILDETEEKRFIKRDVPYSEYKKLVPKNIFRKGKISRSQKYFEYNPREIKNVGEDYKGFVKNEFQAAPHEEYAGITFEYTDRNIVQSEKIDVDKNGFVDISMGKNYTGIFEFTVEFKQEGTLYISFDEILTDDEICWTRGTLNVVTLKGKKGKYHFVSAEPYVMQFIRFVAVDTSIEITDFGLLEIAYPEKLITTKINTQDEKITLIYDAALRSFRSNALDIYMDCPSRERAGWLCDSFFIGRTESALTGDSLVEKVFLNNFLMAEGFENLPEGMLPMCYPADIMNKEFIPNWAMWYGLQVYDYYDRTGDRLLIDNARDRLYGLLEYFKKFENEYGLLENLEGWVFVEWSKANELTQDVSFTSNMVYAALKSAIGVLYNDKKLIEQGRKLREIIKEMAMTESGFFCDNAVRKDGKLCITGERTEVCQYYAFFFKVAKIEDYPDLWNCLVDNFGLNRDLSGELSEIYPANAFIGNYLRMELLLLSGKKDKLFSDIKEYFAYMAERTGTLWEHTNAGASCNHGFASYVICWLKALDLLK